MKLNPKIYLRNLPIILYNRELQSKAQAWTDSMILSSITAEVTLGSECPIQETEKKLACPGQLNFQDCSLRLWRSSECSRASGPTRAGKKVQIWTNIIAAQKILWQRQEYTVTVSSCIQRPSIVEIAYGHGSQSQCRIRGRQWWCQHFHRKLLMTRFTRCRMKTEDIYMLAARQRHPCEHYGW